MKSASPEAGSKPRQRRPSKIKAVGGMTEAQRNMCDLYMKTRDMEQAFLGAGYKANDNSHHLRIRVRRAFEHPNVVKYLEKMTPMVAAQIAWDTNKVISELDRIKELALNDAKYADSLRAVELIGKAMGTFVERTENKNLNANVNFNVSEEQVDADLKRIAKALEAEKLV